MYSIASVIVIVNESGIAKSERNSVEHVARSVAGSMVVKAKSCLQTASNNKASHPQTVKECWKLVRFHMPSMDVPISLYRGCESFSAGLPQNPRRVYE